jgi:hypothetical protein
MGFFKKREFITMKARASSKVLVDKKSVAKVQVDGEPVIVHTKNPELLTKVVGLLSGERFDNVFDCAQRLTTDDFLELMWYYYESPADLERHPRYQNPMNHFKMVQMGLLMPNDRKNSLAWCISPKGVSLLNYVVGCYKPSSWYENWETQNEYMGLDETVPWYTLTKPEPFGLWEWILSPQSKRFFGATHPSHLYSFKARTLPDWDEIDRLVEQYTPLYPFLPGVIDRAKFEYKIRMTVFPETGSPSRDEYMAWADPPEEKDEDAS